MRDLDQRDRALGKRAAEEIRRAVLGDDPVDVGTWDRHRLARTELERDGGAARRRPRGEADDRHAAGGGQRSAVEGRSGGNAAVEHPVQPLGRDLAGQVDAERLRHGDHPLPVLDDGRVADVVDRMEGESGVVVDEVVEAPRAHRPARRDRAGDDARGDEVDDRLGDHVRMDRQVAPVGQVGQHLVRDPPQSDLERGAIVDQTCDVAGDLLGHLADRLVEVLDHGGVHRDEARDPFDRDPAVTRGARHRGVDLRDHGPRGQRGGLGHVDGDPEAAGAVLVGWGDLHHRDIERELSVGEQSRRVGERER